MPMTAFDPEQPFDLLRSGRYHSTTKRGPCFSLFRFYGTWLFPHPRCQAASNANGSVDLYFEPAGSAPNGFEANWIETLPGKGFYPMFRVGLRQH